MKIKTTDENEYYARIKKLNIKHYSGEISYYTKAPMRKVEDKLLGLLRKGTKVLDLGCGSGRFSIGAAQLDLNVTGLDITPDAIKAAETRAKKLELGNVHFIVGDMTKIPFNDNEFDYVFCPRFSINAVATFEKRQAAISEMMRVVKPGGVVYIESFNKLYMGKGLYIPTKNILTDIWRVIRMLLYRVINREYLGLLPGDIVYEANKAEGASIGYAHLPTIIELTALLPKDVSHDFYSIPQILGKKFDPFKYFRYSIWVFLTK